MTEPLNIDTDEVRYQPSQPLPSLPSSGIAPGSTFAAAMLANVNLIQESIGTQSAAFAAKENDFAERVTTANGMYETTEQENTARVQAAGKGMGDEKEDRHGAKPVDYKRDKGDDPQKPDPDKPNRKDQNPDFPRRNATAPTVAATTDVTGNWKNNEPSTSWKGRPVKRSSVSRFGRQSMARTVKTRSQAKGLVLRNTGITTG